MTKELMEIGGFITEGAEIVNHDNSMSGNGTVDSPLGLSNETILFSGLNTTGTITLSEDSNNFDRIRVLYSINDGIHNSCEVIPQSSGVYVGMNVLAFYSNQIRAKGIRYMLSGSTLVPDTSAGLLRSTGAGASVTAFLEASNQAFRVDEVIGINRIANN